MFTKISDKIRCWFYLVTTRAILVWEDILRKFWELVRGKRRHGQEEEEEEVRKG